MTLTARVRLNEFLHQAGEQAIWRGNLTPGISAALSSFYPDTRAAEVTLGKTSVALNISEHDASVRTRESLFSRAWDWLSEMQPRERSDPQVAGIGRRSLSLSRLWVRDRGVHPLRFRVLRTGTIPRRGE